MIPLAVVVEKTNFRPTWAEVSLGTLRRNFRVVHDRVAPHATVCAVVKAHAYGHGAVECALALEQEGAEWLGVTSTDEGLALRQGGIQARVLLMTGFWRGDENWVVEHDLTPAVWTVEHVQRLESAAAAAKKNIAVHLKIDSGMARLGVAPGQLPSVLSALASARHVRLEGLFTHLASAEVIDAPDVQAQIAQFDGTLAAVRAAGFSPEIVHMANSSAIATRPQTWKDMVRPGLALYGYNLPYTSARGPDRSLDLAVSPVLSWKTRIFSLRSVAAGQAIGYSGAYVTPRAAKIAALPVGYADGLSRKLSSRGRVIIRDEYAPIVGNISMDITLVDVTGVAGAEIGDEAMILGATHRRAVTAWDHARIAETIPYEILCNISKRVPRQYLP
jgi:alanine racemase